MLTQTGSVGGGAALATIQGCFRTPARDSLFIGSFFKSCTQRNQINKITIREMCILGKASRHDGFDMAGWGREFWIPGRAKTSEFSGPVFNQRLRPNSGLSKSSRGGLHSIVRSWNEKVWAFNKADVDCVRLVHIRLTISFRFLKI